jgi:hypothetical protein
MTAVVSREHAKATWLTGVAGLVILAAAFVMMACAAPSLAYPRSHGGMTQSASMHLLADHRDLVRKPGRPSETGRPSEPGPQRHRAG